MNVENQKIMGELHLNQIINNNENKLFNKTFSRAFEGFDEQLVKLKITLAYYLNIRRKKNFSQQNGPKRL